MQHEESSEIAMASNHEQQGALTLLFSRQPEGARRGLIESAFRLASNAGHGLSGLMVARRRNELVGAAWAQVLPGRTGLLWIPVLVQGEPDQTAGLLVEHCDKYLRSHDVQLSQVLSDNSQDRPLLTKNGYNHAADLSYLACAWDRLPSSRPSTELEFEPYRADQQSRLEAILTQTYQRTMDCPSLNGVRSLPDVIGGYQRTGVFNPDRWLFARHNHQDIGCLLLTDHPDDDQWELVYMGVVPGARGNNWGEQIARHGAWLTREAKRTQLMLAVDQNNSPALGAYHRVGFEFVAKRSVYLKVMSDALAD